MTARQYIDCKWAHVPSRDSPDMRREAWFRIIRECAEHYGIDETNSAIIGHALRRAV